MENAESINEMLSDESLSRVADNLRRLIRSAIRIVNEGSYDELIPVGVSKIGGLPDLPANARLPLPDPTTVTLSQFPIEADVPLSFIAQIRLSDTVGLIDDCPLPTSGLLSFFYTDFFQGRVLFTSDGVPLARHSMPMSAVVYPTYSAMFTPILLPPYLETCYISESQDVGREGIPGIVSLTQDEWNMYAELQYMAEIKNVDHLLGYSQDAQPYAMETSYQHFRPYLFPELPPWDTLSWDDKQYEHEGNVLLLQVEPKDHPMHFGRGGAVYFFMRRADLLSGNFSKAWAWSQ